MPETRKYGTIITEAGAALIADCILRGTRLPITQAAAGDGGGAYYQPTVDQLGLKNEVWRGEIARAEMSPLSPNMIDVKIVMEDEVGGFTVREMGLFDDEGTMIAVCNTPDTEKVSISGGVSGKLTMLMHIVVADASVLEFSITPALDTVSMDEMEAAIGTHDASPTSHMDIRQLALNSMQEGDAYTKPESDELLAEGITGHNASDAAHPALQVAMSGINSRLTTLELKWGTNVTGNAFEVTFADLASVTVTGVWNESFARIEF